MTITRGFKTELDPTNIQRTMLLQHAGVTRFAYNWGLERKIAAYKGEWNDCLILMADRFFPSSKTCSECGWVNDDLTLSDRTWVCLDCGCVHDRDHNAAVNLENWGVNSLLAVSSTERLNACGEEGSGPSFDSGETDLDEAGIRHEMTVLGGSVFCCPENRFR